ncbi:hypothetical protein PG993_013302 [Apiospora rasikravindrae]|uniref:DUF7580 domain-containing protein n=1 Tax=Apiospora rasikravindrae TaxID=990691 RepID=A0ABR1RYM9_9PEZI
MSGIEVVGLVLGTIPLILTAIEKYKSVQSWRKYSRELNSLRRSLSAELIILEGTCEKLLTGLVAETDIENMIRKPFGSLWKDERIHRIIRRRLWKAYGSFEGTVEDINEAVEQLSAKLGVFNTTRSASSSITGGLERVKFAFNRSQYSDMLKVIAEGNSTLGKLVDLGVNEGMESGRQVRSAARFFSLTRRLSRNVFNAIRCSLSCRCPVSHTVNLELQPPYVQPTPYDDDETVARQIFFRLTLMYDRNNRKAKQTAWLWDEVEIRAEIGQPKELPDMVARRPSPNPQGKPKKRVNFATFPSISATPSLATTSSNIIGLRSQVQTIDGTELFRESLAVAMTGLSVGAATLGMPKPQGAIRDLQDLCHAIEESKRSEKLSGLTCYGYVTDKTASTYNKFGSSTPKGHHYNLSDEWSIVSLRQVLESGGTSLPYLAFRHKQTLAATVASNVLQLAKSPWLPEVFGCEDILFVNLDGSPSYDHAFVSKRLPERDQPKPLDDKDPKHNISGIIQNRTIFSLGIVLLELALGKRLRSLRKPTAVPASDEEGSPTQDAVRRDLLLDYQTALQHLSAVNIEMGPNYHDAVRRCIKCEFMHPTLDLEDDGFRQEVYGKVVALLEANLKNMNSSTRSFT